MKLGVEQKEAAQSAWMQALLQLHSGNELGFNRGGRKAGKNECLEILGSKAQDPGGIGTE